MPLVPEGTNVRYLAIDPGEHTGWATFDKQGEVVRNAYCEDMFAFFDFLNDFDHRQLEVVIIEEYKIRPDKQSTHAWSNVPTLRIIGAIEYWCYINSIKVYFQPPSIKPMGYKFMNGKQTRVKVMSHQLDAMAHGVYYLQVHGIRKPIMPNVKLASGPTFSKSPVSHAD